MGCRGWRPCSRGDIAAVRGEALSTRRWASSRGILKIAVFSPFSGAAQLRGDCLRRLAWYARAALPRSRLVSARGRADFVAGAIVGSLGADFVTEVREEYLELKCERVRVSVSWRE